MFKRFAVKLLNALAIVAGIIALATVAVFIIRWANRPSPNSAEDLLARADKFAWNNNWLEANPLYARAERLFLTKGDQRNALYAHVSQFALKMESTDLATLIAELREDLNRPGAVDRCKACETVGVTGYLSWQQYPKLTGAPRVSRRSGEHCRDDAATIDAPDGGAGNQEEI